MPDEPIYHRCHYGYRIKERYFDHHGRPRVILNAFDSGKPGDVDVPFEEFDSDFYDSSQAEKQRRVDKAVHGEEPESRLDPETLAATLYDAFRWRQGRHFVPWIGLDGDVRSLHIDIVTDAIEAGANEAKAEAEAPSTPVTPSLVLSDAEVEALAKEAYEKGQEAYKKSVSIADSHIRCKAWEECRWAERQFHIAVVRHVINLEAAARPAVKTRVGQWVPAKYINGEYPIAPSDRVFCVDDVDGNSPNFRVEFEVYSYGSGFVKGGCCSREAWDAAVARAAEGRAGA